MPIIHEMKFSRITELAGQWRAEGEKIGFANGCFDICHAGHVSLVRFAKQHCDKLIVGINNDESVGQLKGPGRPLNNVDLRAAVLDEMRSVDCVVIFASLQLEALIRAISPHLIIKGAEYEDRFVVGSLASRIMFAPMVPGLSTTALIERTRNGR
jgi:D-beta-D-heptose 7-phosphate kinase/D-beta-D-heptose 1-phosphate adenosyltransferase